MIPKSTHSRSSGLGITASVPISIRVSVLGVTRATSKETKLLSGTGPAAQVFNLSSDGLGNKIIGTGHNCSARLLGEPSCLLRKTSKQVQRCSLELRKLKPDGTQTEYTSGTTGAEFGLVGEKIRWMVEIDPANPDYRYRKHCIGSFRHENTLRVEAGKKLVAYMGMTDAGAHLEICQPGTVSSPPAKTIVLYLRMVPCTSPVTILTVPVNGFRCS